MELERSVFGRPLWRSLLGLIVVFGGATVRADTEDAVTVGVGACGSRLTGLSEGKKVSGTKVEFGITFWHDPAKNNHGGKPEPDWAHMRLRDLVIDLGPDAWAIESQPGIVNPVSFQYRFASTAFAHNASVPIRVRATIELGYNLAPPNFQVVHTVPYDHVFTVTAYNQASFAGLTAISISGTNPTVEYHVPDVTMSNLSNQLVGHAYALATATNHGKVPATPGAALGLQEPAIRSTITPATMAFWNLHGYQAVGSPPRDIVADSDGWTLAQWNAQQAPLHAVEAAEVAAAVTAKQALFPPYNLAVLYSCHTVDSYQKAQPSSAFASAFGIVAGNQAGRAYMGFAESVNVNCWTPDLWVRADNEGRGDPFKLKGGPEYHNAFVHEQAAVLCNDLAEGEIISEAARFSNETVPTVYFVRTTNPDFKTWPWYRVPPTIVGDVRHRSRYVYLSDAEAQLLGPNVNVQFVRLPVTGG